MVSVVSQVGTVDGGVQLDGMETDGEETIDEASIEVTVTPDEVITGLLHDGAGT
jgi:hypothetical protein